MGLFGGKDWNVIAVIFEHRELYRINGQRAKGGDATKVRDNVKNFDRTILWAVFDQKRAYLEGDVGKGQSFVSPDIVNKLKKELSTNMTVQQVLRVLETAELDKAAKPLVWSGYPKSEQKTDDDE